MKWTGIKETYKRTVQPPFLYVYLLKISAWKKKRKTREDKQN